MDRRTAILIAAVALPGSVALFALTVFPFECGPVESVGAVGAFALVALVEIVLDDASPGD